MLLWIHKLIQPHCDECKHSCDSCETLREQLSIVNAEKQKLLNHVLALNGPFEINMKPSAQELPQPIQSRQVPWKVRREMLEAEDRNKAEILRKKQAELDATKQTTEQLESELGVQQTVAGNLLSSDYLAENK